MVRHWDYWYYTPSEPKKVKNGVKLEAKELGSTWWSRKWLSVLESFGWANRLQRGRNYARRGQVVSFNISAGIVTAKVQGTRPKPYSVTIELKPLSARDWKNVISAMSSQAIFTAKLLLGEMPEDIESVFSNAKLNLFPQTENDLKTHCTCPDVANPCKHIAAVYYIIAEEFDRNPFLIFHLRGRTKEQLLDELRKLRGKPMADKKELKELQFSSETKPSASKVEPLEKCIGHFWKAGEKLKSFSVAIQPPTVPIALLKRLGPPTIWRGSKLDFYLEMERIYKLISNQAMKIAYKAT